MSTAYQQLGYKNREDYLASLADDYGVHEHTIVCLAGLLGPNEDFDGLISALEDVEEAML